MPHFFYFFSISPIPKFYSRFPFSFPDFLSPFSSLSLSLYVSLFQLNQTHTSTPILELDLEEKSRVMCVLYSPHLSLSHSPLNHFFWCVLGWNSCESERGRRRGNPRVIQAKSRVLEVSVVLCLCWLCYVVLLWYFGKRKWSLKT